MLSTRPGTNTPWHPTIDKGKGDGRIRLSMKCTLAWPSILGLLLTGYAQAGAVELSVDIGAGAVWANASRNDFNNSVADIPQDIQNSDFFIGNMIPTVIDADREAGAARNRKTLQGYVSLPNYRNYWKQAGYVEEMEGIEAAIANGEITEEEAREKLGVLRAKESR